MNQDPLEPFTLPDETYWGGRHEAATAYDLTMSSFIPYIHSHTFPVCIGGTIGGFEVCTRLPAASMRRSKSASSRI